MRHLAVGLAIALFAAGADATSLYALGANVLYQIDPATGASQIVSALPDRVWRDIAGRPGDTSHVYAVECIVGTSFVNRVSTIDVSSGAVTDLYRFRATDFGFETGSFLELVGITIDESSPSTATVAGYVFFGG